MKNQIPTKVKTERKNQIMEVQQKVSLAKNKKVKGKKLEVLVEGMLEDGTYFGRTYKDAPEIDGYTFIETKKDLPLGEYTKVKIKQAQEYDLIGKI
jgi:ribosomal protein S12 methylthiotransferase